MKIAYVPIDERPCNTSVVERIAQSAVDLELIIPPVECFGLKKRPADTEGLWEWLNQVGKTADALILSIDMLLYGGLIPSRLHHFAAEKGADFIHRLRSFHHAHPKLLIYGAISIMRTPQYSSNDEEPDYYQEWGRELFLRASLIDKQNRDLLSQEDQNLLNQIQAVLPKEYIEDYETRRSFNLSITSEMLYLVDQGVLMFLSIPQDDSAEYGYTALDQKIIVSKRERLRLQQKVHMYPGSDEVGATLLTRVFSELKQIRTKIYPLWSSTLGPQLVPMYEDRPFAESMKSHLLAAGCQFVENPEAADLILAYNTPGRVMQESWEQTKKDITYTSFRNLLNFVDQITEYLHEGKKVILADSAYANGSDLELISLLDNAEVLDQLLSYKGWNTNCNTLGTTIAQGVLGQFGHPRMIRENILYHLFDDCFYQAKVRMEMVEDFLPQFGLNYFDLKEQAEVVNLERNKRLLTCYKELIWKSFQGIKIEEVQTYAPWNRMFECGIQLKFGKQLID